MLTQSSFFFFLAAMLDLTTLSVLLLFLMLQAAMLDLTTLSVLYLTDVASETSSPVISLDVRSFLDANNLIQSPKDSQSKIMKDSEMGFLFTMTRNAHFSVRDITTGNLVCIQPLQPKKDCTAISMHIIG